MRLVTWNINSLRARVERVEAWLATRSPDVLCLQETKTGEDTFPMALFTNAGYEVAQTGLGSWNGVAIASRVGLADVQTSFTGQPGFPEATDAPEPRAISAVCGGIRVWSLYVPNGRELGNPHYDYKLAWLEALRLHVAQSMKDAVAGDGPDIPVVLVGDFNVAPADADVWDVAVFEGSTHVTPAERAAVQGLLDLGLTDLARVITPEGPIFTYWDYRQLAFPKKRGMRIDLALGSPQLVARLKDVVVDREERKGKSPSDHAPLLIDLTDG